MDVHYSRIGLGRVSRRSSEGKLEITASVRGVLGLTGRPCGNAGDYGR